MGSKPETFYFFQIIPATLILESYFKIAVLYRIKANHRSLNKQTKKHGEGLFLLFLLLLVLIDLCFTGFFKRLRKNEIKI